jgi:periplasmic protein TonB
MLRRFTLVFAALAVTAGAALADPASDKAGWESALERAIMAKTDYPQWSQLFHTEGVAFVHFVVDRKGNVSGVRIVRSSGSLVLDGHSIRAVYAAAPLPGPPADVEGDRFDFTMPIRYRLSNGN